MSIGKGNSPIEKSENTQLYSDAAGEYAAHSAENFCNAQYERAAVLEVIGEVRGKAVLDAGCAGGEYAAHLLADGAHVTALDASQAMVAIVTKRFGDTVIARQHDLAEPVSWLGDASMDIVVSSLTLHYLRDWSLPLSEFRRILKPGGRLVMSTHHPAMVQQLLGSGQSYFDRVLVEDRWRIGQIEHQVRFYHRPLEDIVNSIVSSGFAVQRLVEPRLTQPLPDVPVEWFQKLSTTPWFLIVEASVTKGSDQSL